MAQKAKKVSEIEEVKAAIIRDQWGVSGAEKGARYVGKFFDRQRTGKKIIGKVVGNHGTYTVSLSVKAGRMELAAVMSVVTAATTAMRWRKPFWTIWKVLWPSPEKGEGTFAHWMTWRAI
jgi:hypothetical protein